MDIYECACVHRQVSAHNTLYTQNVYIIVYVIII